MSIQAGSRLQERFQYSGQHLETEAISLCWSDQVGGFGGFEPSKASILSKQNAESVLVAETCVASTLSALLSAQLSGLKCVSYFVSLFLPIPFNGLKIESG